MVRLPKFVEVDDATEFQYSPNRREVSRHLVKAEVEITNASGAKAAMRVEDLSTHGCSIKGEVQWLRLGMILSIVLTNEPPVQAIIRWVRDGKAGAEFFRPLSAKQTEWHILMAEQGF